MRERMVETWRELSRLEDGTVILDANNRSHQLMDEAWMEEPSWLAAGDIDPVRHHEVVLPAQIIWENNGGT